VSLKNSIILKVLEHKIDIANVNYKDRIKKLCNKYPTRSAGVKFTDFKDDIGFALDPKNERIVMLPSLPNPTVLLVCSSRVFKALLAKKIKADDVFYGGLGDVIGDNPLRDKIVLQDFLEIVIGE